MKLNLLIASDGAACAEKISARLKAAGLDCTWRTASGPDELQGAAAEGAPDLIILDYGLKGWNGDEALKAACGTFPRTPCVVIADGQAAEKKDELLGKGAAAFLPRESLDGIARVVSEALRLPAPGAPQSAAAVPGLIYYARGEGGAWLEIAGDAAALTGYTAEALLKAPALWRTRMDPADAKSLERRDAILKSAGRAECEYRWTRADGEVRWFLDLQRLGGDRIAGLVVDITESKRAGNRQAAEKRMEAVGRLAGGLAHDFHNLLSSVLGYSALMLGNMPPSDPLREDLNEIHKAAERAVVLTRQLLVFSKKQSYQPQPLDLNSVFTGVQSVVRQLMREDIRGISDTAENLPAVNADLVQLEQVLVGLAINVCDLIQQGGTLTVCTRAVDVGADYCKAVPGARPGPFVLLSVSGTGKALEKETLETVFEPYSAPAGDRLGVTLTLPAIYGIVRQHGGWITARSEEGAGTTFEVYLPAAAEDSAPAETAASPAVRKIGGNGERILLVEDEEALRKFVGRVLRENGYTVFAAGSFKETMEIFRKEKGNFHLVFTDVVLPDKTGVELAEELLALKPALRIIFNSGYVNEKSQWPAIQKKGLKFLQKPYTIHNMLSAIKDVIKRPDV